MTTTNNQQGCTYLAPDYDAHTSRISPAPYCGCKNMYKDSAYCEEHYPVVYQEGTANRKRRKDLARAEYTWNLASEFNDIVVELELEDEGVEL